MTPAIKAAEKAGIPFSVHRYDHDPNHPSFGEEAVEALGVPGERVFKTLLAVCDDRRQVVAVLPVPARLDLKALAGAAGAKRAQMLEPAVAERLTGYVTGGISPLGQRKRLPLWLDASADALDTLYVSAGRRGLEIELSPADLLRLTGGRLAPLAR